MKKYLFTLLILLSFPPTVFSSPPWNGRIIKVSTQNELSLKELTAELAKSHTIILGEKHNTASIQLVESLIINDVVKATHAENHFITAWEFLNYPEQKIISQAYEKFSIGQITALEFLIATQGKPTNKSYIPILETTRALQGNIIGVNLSREIKEPVTKGGIDALDPQYLPPHFAMGGTAYHQRFIEIMDGHVPKEALENYYAAQCLTDDVMAYTLQHYVNAQLLFLITGSFHTDYFQGVVERIHVRLADPFTSIIRLIDASDYDEKELDETFFDILHDKTYGNIADYVFFVNEPVRQLKK